MFEGTVIAKKHGGIEETFTVRRISYGVGVEKVFPVHAPSIEKVEVVMWPGYHWMFMVLLLSPSE